MCVKLAFSKKMSSRSSNNTDLLQSEQKFQLLSIPIHTKLFPKRCSDILPISLTPLKEKTENIASHSRTRNRVGGIVIDPREYINCINPCYHIGLKSYDINVTEKSLFQMQPLVSLDF